MLLVPIYEFYNDNNMITIYLTNIFLRSHTEAPNHLNDIQHFIVPASLTS